MHDRLAVTHELRGVGMLEQAEAASREAAGLRELAMGAAERLLAAQHRVDAEELPGQEEEAEFRRAAARQAQDREREEREREERIRLRLTERRRRDQAGLRRLRLGPGTVLYSPGMLGTSGASRAYAAEEDLDREIGVIGHALDQHGATERTELARLIGARYWGPGRFGAALREAVAEGRVRRISARTYGPIKQNPEEEG
jgi:hypothetical protein